MISLKNIFKRCVVSIITWEAQLLLSRTKPTIIAITGSVGKTSTKDAIYAALKNHLHARKSQKSYNSEIGVPLSVLGLENAWSNPFFWIKNIVDGLLLALFVTKYPKVLILETGVDRPGDMQRLTEWLKPNIVVLTRLPDVPVHVEYFANPEAVIEEKMHLVRALSPDGVLIYNHDDERVRKEAENIRQKSVGYSRYSQSHFMASGDEIELSKYRPIGTSFTVTHVDTSARFSISGSLGVQHVYSCAAAAAVADQFDIPLQVVAESMHAYVPPPGRMRIIAGKEHSLILDDSYNSSPVATERALQTLAELQSYGQRKVVVLGDMLELGKHSSREHERVGEYVAKVADILVAVGVRSRKTAEGALEYGLSEKNIFQYDTIEDAMVEVPNLIQEGDVVLVKASQSIRAEKLVAILMEEPERAGELLVRQDSMWDKR